MMRIFSEKELYTYLESENYTTREDLLRAIYLLFEEKNGVIKKELNMDNESVLYNQYYWYIQFQNEYTKNNGFDAGIEQKNIKLLEIISSKIDIDWDVIEKITNNIIKEGNNGGRSNCIQ